MKKLNRIAYIEKERQKCKTEAPRPEMRMAKNTVRGNYLNQDLANNYHFRTYIDNKTQFTK